LLEELARWKPLSGGLESKFKANLDWTLDAGMMMCALAGVIERTLPLELTLAKRFDAEGEN
jgi:hypothetical protein